MKYNPQKHNRRSIRLKGYDYTKAGSYFVTICVNNRLCLFGEIIEYEMNLNDAGKMVKKIWQGIPQYYPNFDVDFYIVMPNHFHGIILMFKENDVGASHCGRPFNSGQTQWSDPTKRLSLGDMIGRFKSYTTHEYLNGVKNFYWEPFYKKLWQRNYYEHIHPVRYMKTFE